MNRCNNPAHPHCTVWVMPGEDACAHGHRQADGAAQADLGPVQPALPAGLAPLSPLAASGPAKTAAPDPIIVALPSPSPSPRVRVSGFDPRAAGGRQQLKLELQAMPADCAARLTLLAGSRLHLEGDGRHLFTRDAHGDWLPLFIEFSSKGLEHGQYRIELELHSLPDGGAPARAWTATLLILVPRADASLVEIHQAFLATHRKVRVHAEDASIARLRGQLDGGGRLDVDVSARNAGIAQLDLGAGSGKVDLGFSSIAWEEALFEIDLPAQAARGASHPCPASTACLVMDTPAQCGARYLRLFALDECVLGRHETGAQDTQADILLAHHDGSGPVAGGLTRRLSARHALLRRGRDGVDIEDVSRYGLLVDGAWAARHAPLTLRAGMRIAFTASIPGVAMLEVAAVLPHGVVLRRADAGREHELFVVLEPEHDPGRGPWPQEAHEPGPERACGSGYDSVRDSVRDSGHGRGYDQAAGPPGDAPAPPLLFHRNGGFWHRDPVSGVDTPLAPAGTACLPGVARFTAHPYPELRRAGGADRRAPSALAATAR